jgi:hypothetical protein
MGAAAMNISSTSSTAFSAKVVRLPSATSKIIVIEPDYAWRAEVQKRFKAVCDLTFGWDGYQAQPVSFPNVVFAMNMLDSTCGNDVPAPQIVPGVNGDLQIEWHTLKGDVELHVLGPNRVHGWRKLVGPDQREDELELDIEFSAVAAWVREITEQPRAIDAAAA